MFQNIIVTVDEIYLVFSILLDPLYLFLESSSKDVRVLYSIMVSELNRVRFIDLLSVVLSDSHRALNGYRDKLPEKKKAEYYKFLKDHYALDDVTDDLIETSCQLDDRVSSDS